MSKHLKNPPEGRWLQCADCGHYQPTGPLKLDKDYEPIYPDTVCPKCSGHWTYVMVGYVAPSAVR